MSSNKLIKTNQEGEDFISELPEQLLSTILSYLPTDEAVCTSILSKKWTHSWRFVSRLDIDQTQMTSKKKHSRLSKSKIMINAKTVQNYKSVNLPTKIFNRVVEITSSILNSHRGELSSFRLVHFPKCLENGILEGWVRYLVEEKEIQDLVLVRAAEGRSKKFLDPTDRVVLSTLILPINILLSVSKLVLENYNLGLLVSCTSDSYTNNLETLKLSKICIGQEILEGVILSNCKSLKNLSLVMCFGFKKLKIDHTNIIFLELQDIFTNEIHVTAVNLGVLVLHSIGCEPKGLVIDIPNLKVFCAYCVDGWSNFHLKSMLETNVILEECSDLLRSDHPRQYPNIFENLLVLKVDLELNKVREAMPLAYVLRSCPYLEKLEVIILKSDEYDSDGSLPYPSILFWEKREYSDYSHRLKFVTIMGFEAREQEMEFAKHLITRGTKLKMFTVFFNKCSSDRANTGLGLLKVPRASLDLCIEFKPAKEDAYGDQIEDWALKYLDLV
ncbi:F-box domain-containing protein/FBD domain-containing protein [Quillaja saponaria]|uniref:F-box domain-containing protein/FBD domain-containing protein n=1 Tax=Quillaja saponaria TaxID=32244 RepID=A0AAD7L110_QUISA|nr:F-box domain-containing protein/FBD domain-containing protein [Quillaja saponaria]